MAEERELNSLKTTLSFLRFSGTENALNPEFIGNRSLFNAIQQPFGTATRQWEINQPNVLPVIVIDQSDFSPFNSKLALYSGKTNKASRICLS